MYGEYFAMIVKILSNISICFFQVLFLLLNLKPKRNPYITFLAIFIPFTFFAFSRTFLPSVSPTFLVIVNWCIYFAGIFFLFSDPVKTKILISLISFTTGYISASIVLTIFAMFIENFASASSPAVASAAVLCILLMLITLFIKIKKNRVSISKLQAVPFIVVPLSQVGLIYAAWLLFYSEFLKSQKKLFPIDEPNYSIIGIVIIIALILCVAADFILFVLMKRVSQNNAMREELRFIEYKSQTSLDYYRTIEKNAFETRKIRHDLNNILQVIYGLEESGAPNGEAISSIIAAQLKSSIDSIKIEKFSENMLVNAIAANKAEVCREKKIDFNFDLRVPEKTNIKEIDLCKAFVNIIDNAINAASELAESERKIEISSFVDGDFLYIKSINPSLASNTKSEPREGHGLGQKILTDIAESYGGKFITSNENGIYTALLTVQKQGD